MRRSCVLLTSSEWFSKETCILCHSCVGLSIVYNLYTRSFSDYSPYCSIIQAFKSHVSQDFVLYFNTCPTPVPLNNEYKGRTWFGLQPWKINVIQVPTTEYIKMPVQIGTIIGWYVYSGPSVWMCIECQGLEQWWGLVVLK